MAAITAAAISAAVAVGTTAYTASQQGGGGGGSDRPKNFYGKPEDPQDEAIKNYFARLNVENVGTKYPDFGQYLQSGGDPAKAQMDVKYPALKPSEAAALGITGGRGESYPGVDPTTGETVNSAALSPEQRLYLARERYRKAKAQGVDPGGWEEHVVNQARRYSNLTSRLTDLGAIEDPNQRQQNRIERLTQRKEMVGKRLTRNLGGAPPTPTGRYDPRYPGGTGVVPQEEKDSRGNPMTSPNPMDWL